MGKLRAFLLLLLPALCLAQYAPPGTSGSGISACSTSPPTAGAAHATCYDTSGVIWQCNNGSSACTTSGQWVSQGGSGSPTGAAGGDLAGSYPDPTVAQVNGAAVPASAALTGTNSSRQIIAANANQTYDELETTSHVAPRGHSVLWSAGTRDAGAGSPARW